MTTMNLWTYAIFDAYGNLTSGAAETKKAAEAAVLRKIQADYGDFPGCPTTYDDEVCSDFSVEMGDGLIWQIQQVELEDLL